MSRAVSRSIAFLTLGTVGAALVFLLAAGKPSGGAHQVTMAGVPGLETRPQLPLFFEPNVGQTDPQVRFLSRGSMNNVHLTPNGLAISLGADGDSAQNGGHNGLLGLELVGSNPSPLIEGLEELPGRSHYLLGEDPAQWKTHVKQFGKVRYAGVYPGIDLVFYGKDQRLSYDFVVAPGADPGAIGLRAWGGALKLDPQGRLVADSDAGELVQERPIVYQDANGARTEIDGRFTLRGPDLAGFELGAYDPALPLVIDPILYFVRYLGGTSSDSANGIAVGADGGIYLTGTTYSQQGFPISGPAVQGAPGGSSDAFVAKLSPNGANLIYATYLGGDSSDEAFDIAVDVFGNAYVSGYTESGGFPPSDALQLDAGGGRQVLVVVLSPDGSSFKFKTKLTSSGDDVGRAIAIDAAGDIYVAGDISIYPFPEVKEPPVTPSIGRTERESDGFLAKFDVQGDFVAVQLVYSHVFGGTGDTFVSDLAVDAGGNAYLTGISTSDNLPTTAGTFQKTRKGDADGFVLKWKPGPTGVVWGTYLGGSLLEWVTGIAVDGSGNVYVVGVTASTNFPVKKPLQGYKGGGDGFVAKLASNGKTLVYSTFFGGSGEDAVWRVAVDGSGTAWFTGETKSSDLQLVGATQGSNSGQMDAFVAAINTQGSAFTFATYLGGELDESPQAIAVAPNGRVYVVGNTGSPGFGTKNQYAGNTDAFVAVFAPVIIDLPITLIPTAKP